MDIQRAQHVFYISHYSVMEINLFHDGSVAENTTEQVNWYFSSAVVSSWKGLTFIIHVFFPRYSVEIIVGKINICVLNTIRIAWKSSWKRLIYVWWTRYINLFHDFLSRYIVEHIFKRFNMPNINVYLKCISFLKLYTREFLQSALSCMSQWSVEINYGTNR